VYLNATELVITKLHCIYFVLQNCGWKCHVWPGPKRDKGLFVTCLWVWPKQVSFYYSWQWWWWVRREWLHSFPIVSCFVCFSMPSSHDDIFLHNIVIERRCVAIIWYYSESRLMLSPVNVIIRLMWSCFIVPFTSAD
jgi:hypothetical protein